MRHFTRRNGSWCLWGPTTALLLACTACGESHESGDASLPDGTIGDSRAADSSATDSGTRPRDSGTLVPDCPSAIPADGDHCDHPGLSCEYGDDWSSRCNYLAQCWVGGPSDGTWMVRDPDPTVCPTPTTLGPGCPPEPPSGTCTESDPTDLCVYGDAHCVCYPFVSSGPGGTTTYQWRCDDPSLAECPPNRPRVGSACTLEGETCTYAVCNFGGGTYCSDGVWSDAIVPNFCAGGMGG